MSFLSRLLVVLVKLPLTPSPGRDYNARTMLLYLPAVRSSKRMAPGRNCSDIELINECRTEKRYSPNLRFEMPSFG
jgi:hypothetical protein